MKKTKESVNERIERDVRRLEARVASQEQTARFIVKVQIGQLAEAEKLRTLALDVVRSKWQHRCSDRVGGCVAVSESKLRLLATFVRQLTKFHSAKGKMPAAVKKLLADSGKGR